MKRLLSIFFLAVFIFTFAIGPPVSAVTPPVAEQPKGLFVTPPRQYLNVAAGKAATGTFTVGNLNDAPMKVVLSVGQFSLADYTYDYNFSAPKEDWVKLSKTQVDLAPKTSQTVTYSINPPIGASPGGHYFSIFASATISPGKQVRTALILYATVDGKLKKTSEIVSDTLPLITFSGSIPLHLNIKNTGNTHFFVYISGKLSGWFLDQKRNEVAHVLLPQTIRSVETTIQPPAIPGIYQATYGYRNEEGQYTEKKKYIAYVPIWFWVTLGGTIWLAIVLLRRKRRLRKDH
ncbi:MAG TPA: hypothetical protein VK497_05000 [Candidatus Saccharimonadales bacterium]|nr:hypothetical protein [Candidatus Saccharimonadales bacterium]